MRPLERRPPCGGRGLKLEQGWVVKDRGGSPSLRRAWIEMALIYELGELGESPSLRRAWIEIGSYCSKTAWCWVALPAEGVD